MSEKLVKAKIELSPEQDVLLTYAQHGLALMQSLKTSLMEAAANDIQEPLLSVNQQQNVTTLIQLIIAFGALPSMLPGVGLPLEKRSKFYSMVQPQEQGSLSVEEKHQRLVKTMLELLELIEEPTLSQIVLTKHLGDILAILIQLSSAPLKKPSSQGPEETANTTGEGKFHMTQDMYDKFVKEQQEFKEKLLRIVTKIFPPLAVKYLLLLQSCGATQVVKPIPKSINASRHPTPKWVQASCGHLLTHLLTSSPNGVLNIIQGILDVGHEDNQDMQKYVIIANVISNPPSTGKYAHLDEYFKLICQQILAILQKKNDPSQVYHTIACHCIRALTERSLILSRKYLLEPLFEPLIRLFSQQCQKFEDVNQDSGAIISENELENCIEKIHLCFVVINDPSLMFVRHLDRIIMALMELHCRISLGVSHLRKPVEDLVKRYLKWSSQSVSLAAIRAFVLNEEGSSFKPMHAQYLYVPGSHGGTKVILKDNKKAEENNFYMEDGEKAIIIIDLLTENVDLKNLGAEFYLSLLNDLNHLMLTENADDNDEIGVENIEEQNSSEEKLLQLEQDLDRTMMTLRRKLMVIKMLELLSEDKDLQEQVMKNSMRLIQFLLLTFQRCAKLCQSRVGQDQDYRSGMAEQQSLLTALTLLNHIVTGSTDVQEEQWEALLKSVEDLKILSECHGDLTIKTLSGKLLALINANVQAKEHQEHMKRKVDEIVHKTKEAQIKMEELKELNEKVLEERRDTYEDCLNHLEDKEVPIRGHGLIALTKLVNLRDEEAMKHIEDIFQLFLNNLVDTDTYIYLQAVKGLSACSFYKPDVVITKLCREYALLDDNKYPGDKGLELRTKLGEALVNITKILGELTPAYKNKLLNPFLAQLNHPDPLIRASSLSNLGEICKNLRFALGNVVQEMFQGLHAVLQWDKAIEVKRAAVLVLKLMLEGLGDDAFEVLQGLIRDIWKTLILLKKNEHDDIMQIHVDQAIDEINKIVKKFLTPSNEPKKTIYVLDSPPNPF